jgi:hypothetical protein
MPKNIIDKALPQKNHQVFQKGGKTVIFNDTPVWFQTPSLFDPLTLNTYFPGGSVV